MEKADSRRHRYELAGGVLVVCVFIMLFRSMVLPERQERIGTVACIGDSITFGTGVIETRDTDAYPAQLQLLLGERYKVQNYGASGRTLLDNTGKSYRDTGYLDVVLAGKPDYIIVMLGSNDSKPQNWQAEEYKKQYVSLVVQLKEIQRDTKIYLVSPPAVFDVGVRTSYGIDNTVIRDQIREIVREVAEQTGAGWIDLYAVTKDHPEYFPDGVHPNLEGNILLAETICEEIRQSPF